MQHSQRPNRSFTTGLLAGLVIAAGGALMLGMNNQQQKAAPEFDYYVTPGDQSNNTARLWRRHIERETLEFVGNFQPTTRGR